MKIASLGANYKRDQIARHGQLPRSKGGDLIDEAWVTNEEVDYLSKYLKKNIKDLKFGICQGVCNGAENRRFADKLGIEVIGTEIAKKDPNVFNGVIEWDMNEAKDEWIDNVDFMYTNSFDHTDRPQECLKTWMKCIKKDGMCILAWSGGHVSTNGADCFGATFEEYKKLVEDCGFKVHDVITWDDLNIDKDNFSTTLDGLKETRRQIIVKHK